MNTIIYISSNFGRLETLRPVIKQQHVVIASVALAAIALFAIALRNVYPAVRMVSTPQVAESGADENSPQMGEEMEEEGKFNPINLESLSLEEWKDIPPEDRFMARDGYCFSIAVLTPAYWASLKGINPYTRQHFDPRDLAQLNDLIAQRHGPEAPAVEPAEEMQPLPPFDQTIGDLIFALHHNVDVDATFIDFDTHLRALPEDRKIQILHSEVDLGFDSPWTLHQALPVIADAVENPPPGQELLYRLTANLFLTALQLQLNPQAHLDIPEEYVQTVRTMRAAQAM